MARKSTEELKARALELAEGLGMDAEDLNLDQGNSELSKLVKDLELAAKAKTQTDGTPPEPEQEQEQERTPAPEPAEKLPPFTVAKGKAITSRRGIRTEGDAVEEKDLAGGKEALAALIERGYVVES